LKFNQFYRETKNDIEEDRKEENNLFYSQTQNNIDRLNTINVITMINGGICNVKNFHW